ncbi:MAG TPA: D-alanyl-D-alanine carboxypeptidase/D-alanyl-D-alanine-endopeptidase [Gammaproteobacteria bacterium]|nr:D-alanyl-D-alanine carboxypeptidase/D-alanyl-D-alanine-endopeptidase [Gammaproteobacteria bacterium]
MRWGAPILILCCWLGAAAHAADLPAAVDLVLSGHRVDPGAVSIVVQAVGAPKPVLSHLPDTPRNPASVMKLVTTWTALQLLGPTYTWPTEVYFLGERRGPKLDGDLALKGYGDPFLVLENFWKLLRAVHRLGVDDIAGNLVLDDSYFDVREDDPGELDGQPFRTYNVLPDALLVNFEAVEFQVQADAEHHRVELTAEPPLPDLHIENRIKLADGPCRGYHDGVSFAVVDAGLAHAVLGGQFPASCLSYGFARAVLEPDTYAYGLFELLWKEIGGSFHGKLRRGDIPEGMEPALTWRSPPLDEIIRSVNKFSNNVMARQLLYTLGAVRGGAPGTRSKGVAVIRDFLASQGLDVGPLVMDNGAGLSREGRVSARLLADLLLRAARSPYAPEFISSLSLAGLDGTTRVAFDDLSDMAAMHVKTGTLDQVSALAGYVRAGDGQDYVVVVLLNSRDADRGPGHELDRALLSWVAGLGTKGAPGADLGVKTAEAARQ